MKTSFEILGSIFLVLGLNSIAQGKDWRGIAPLHSTRADVERLLGPPVDEGNLIALYRTKDEAVQVFYAAGTPCKPDTVHGGWAVPPDTVVKLTVRQVYDPEKGASRPPTSRLTGAG